MTAEKILEAIKEKRAVFGTSIALKLMRPDEIEAVYLASNCPKHITEQINSNAVINKIPVSTLKENSEELAVLCKKPFSISVISIKKVKEKE